MGLRIFSVPFFLQPNNQDFRIMKFKLLFALLLAVATLKTITAPVFAGDVNSGKVKAEQQCQTCHGMDGIGTMPMVANITGQQEFYLISQLENYKSGKRQHEQMSIIASMLSDDDIKDVAAWYSKIKITIELPK